MPQTVILQLITAGSTTGPFDLYSNVDGFTTPFEEGISKAALLSGYESVLVPDGTIMVRIKSDGQYCSNSTDVYIGQPTTSTTSTTTSTTSTTTTAPPTTTSTTTTTTTAAPTTTTTSTTSTTTSTTSTTTTAAPTTTTTSTTTTTTTAAPTTTTTSTTTTTLQPIYYGIAQCGTSWNGATYTQAVAPGTFSGGNIVVNATSGIYYVVQSSSTSNPGPVSIVSVQSTGFLTCPSTTTTTSSTTTTTTAAPTTTTTTTSTTSTTSTTTSTTSTTTTSTTTTTTTLAPSSALFGISTTNSSAACSSLFSSPETFYWENGVSFGPGVTLYQDPALTIKATGYVYVCYDGNSGVYNISSGTAIVGSFVFAC